VESIARFESALSTTQGGTEAALKSAGALTRELRKARAAAASGQVREMRRALDAAGGMAAELSAAVGDARASFDIDETVYLASGDYAKELLAAAAERGVRMFEEDERLLCYPSLVRVVPNDSMIEVDRRRERRLRPSVVISLLAAAQQRPPRFRAEQFLESLAGGYELVTARAGKNLDAVARVTDIWSALTLLPGQAKDYTRPEFARDLYLLDQSGARQTKEGRTLRWHASSGTRTAGVLTTVARTGQQQRYWGVSFTTGAPR
jgi:hypothetical protein